MTKSKLIKKQIGISPERLAKLRHAILIESTGSTPLQLRHASLRQGLRLSSAERPQGKSIQSSGNRLHSLLDKHFLIVIMLST